MQIILQEAGMWRCHLSSLVDRDLLHNNSLDLVFSFFSKLK
ncbi:hypothetical protein EV05_1931 [Prochlorococcus sp. MIT 0601]|nr:hypothetical protein EV05_1931 [Prochlorococcus sp. MIT 0601]